MATEVTIHEAKTHFSKLVRRVEAGEEIIVRRGSEPVAKLVAYEKPERVSGRGSMKGRRGTTWHQHRQDLAEHVGRTFLLDPLGEQAAIRRPG